ncbi:ComF family protein [Polymorphobacter fuscus]|uniref:ComF family protein n=1 Tax=Sandarakinorhabdus fusca TaxID=1439888 RepID=A0A7C9KM22_9SPHN|nr:ComF family protein [Polymorphobacter fuscus]KAB7647434.1 ComF family protein [Polymorphobacter fuscus]MQT16684.1 ComF family protein [Polymorphobacter fuscus]NJC09330.1 ComF family protein [Polymorphobacter fuscus]
MAASDLLALLALPVRTIVDLVLPPRCPACRTIVDGDGRFCVDCWQQLDFITAPMCATCGTPFEHDRGAGTQCGACLAEPPHYARARAALAYGGPARTVLLAMKHGDRQHLAAVMAPHMLRAAADLLVPDAVLVPVPLHRWRLWRRGFNQAAVLAQELARLSGMAVDVTVLARVKATPPSAGMGRKARAANVRGAFRVVDKARVRGRDVVVIDDVLTTGATADACARHLRRAGARSVSVLTFARVVRDVG